MPLIKAKELRELGEDELRQRVERLRKELFDLRQQKEVGQLDRPHRISAVRREIAQVFTVWNEKTRKAAPKKP
jgi:large subunit ribosomal protein L29